MARGGRADHHRGGARDLPGDREGLPARRLHRALLAHPRPLPGYHPQRVQGPLGRARPRGTEPHRQHVGRARQGPAPQRVSGRIGGDPLRQHLAGGGLVLRARRDRRPRGAAAVLPALGTGPLVPLAAARRGQGTAAVPAAGDLRRQRALGDLQHLLAGSGGGPACRHPLCQPGRRHGLHVHECQPPASPRAELQGVGGHLPRLHHRAARGRRHLHRRAGGGLPGPPPEPHGGAGHPVGAGGGGRAGGVRRPPLVQLRPHRRGAARRQAVRQLPLPLQPAGRGDHRRPGAAGLRALSAGRRLPSDAAPRGPQPQGLLRSRARAGGAFGGGRAARRAPGRGDPAPAGRGQRGDRQRRHDAQDRAAAHPAADRHAADRHPVDRQGDRHRLVLPRRPADPDQELAALERRAGLRQPAANAHPGGGGPRRRRARGGARRARAEHRLAAVRGAPGRAPARQAVREEPARGSRRRRTGRPRRRPGGVLSRRAAGGHPLPGAVHPADPAALGARAVLRPRRGLPAGRQLHRGRRLHQRSRLHGEPRHPVRRALHRRPRPRQAAGGRAPVGRLRGLRGR